MKLDLSVLFKLPLELRFRVLLLLREKLQQTAASQEVLVLLEEVDDLIAETRREVEELFNREGRDITRLNEQSLGRRRDGSLTDKKEDLEQTLLVQRALKEALGEKGDEGKKAQVKDEQVIYKGASSVDRSRSGGLYASTDKAGYASGDASSRGEDLYKQSDDSKSMYESSTERAQDGSKGDDPAERSRQMYQQGSKSRDDGVHRSSTNYDRSSADSSGAYRRG